jgi:aminoglycoside phosphotransferase (APT) family kinase protein
MPAAEYPIDEALARALLRDQHPDLAELRLTLLGTGWDNVMFRLGDALTLRLPRRLLGAELIAHELRWVPMLAPRLPLAVPVPVRAGRPALGYPWPWSIVGWLPGEMAAVTPPADERAAAIALGNFLRALHQPAPADAPHNPYRGVPLATRDERVANDLTELQDVLAPKQRASLAAEWRELRTTPPWRGPPSWVHGDVHPCNLLVHQGQLSAVIDFGDVCAGDPASDLAVAWMLFSDAARDLLRSAAGRGDDDAFWRRARAWAITIALAATAGSGHGSIVRAMGLRTLDLIAADPLP